MTILERTTTWVEVCGVDDLVADRGACALVGPYQVALFRISPADDLYALSNYDPFSDAYVLSRGIVGSKGETPKVTSPVYKQSFDLRTGRCLEDPSVEVMSFPVRELEGRVLVGLA
ncbi:MAG: nitrite reductase small subunit NirD [Acidimicrobiales bacterium]